MDSPPPSPERASARKLGVPPRWFVRTAWVVHRAIHRVSRGGGLRRPSPGKFGMMALHTTGRRSGQERVAIVAYVLDGPDLVTMAMNGWADPPPAWWLNLRAEPAARVRLPGGEVRAVRAREALDAEHDRLWEVFREHEDASTDLDALARLRSGKTSLVVLEPAP